MRLSPGSVFGQAAPGARFTLPPAGVSIAPTPAAAGGTRFVPVGDLPALRSIDTGDSPAAGAPGSDVGSSMSPGPAPG